MLLSDRFSVACKRFQSVLAASFIDSAAYRGSMPGCRPAEYYAAEAQPELFTHFSRFHIPPQALTAADLAAPHIQNQLSRVALGQRAIKFWRDVE
jgi:hypothetical protein